MILRDLLAHSQADTRTLIFILSVKSLKDVEDLAGIALVESDAVVLKRDLKVIQLGT